MFTTEPRARTRSIALLAAVAAAAAVYGPHLGNGFVWDDHGVIEGNPAVTGADPLREVFVRDLWYAQGETHGVRLVYYRPLWVLAARALWALGGGAPWPFHAASLALHLVNVLLVFLVLPRLSDRRWAGPVALLYAVHPLACEAVSWAASFGDVLVLTSLLAALLAASVLRTASSRGSQVAAGSAALLASAVAMFTKESGLIVAVLVTAEGLRAARADWWSRVAASWPVWVPIAAYSAIRAWLVGDAGNVLALDGFPARFATAATVLAWDLRRLVWPFPLSPVHSAPSVSTAATAASVTVCAATLIATAALARWRPREAFWALWLLLPLLPPVAQAFASNGNGLLFAERYLYLSVVPATFAIVRAAAAAVAALPVPRHTGAASLGAAAIALGLVTTTYASAYDGDPSHAARTLEVYPDNPVALTAQGRAWLAKGVPRRALPLFQKAAVQEPWSAIDQLNVALAQRQLGRFPEAIAAYRRAIELDAGNVPALLGLGDCLRENGDLDGAGAQYAAAVSAAPGNVDARVALGAYLFTKGQVVAATAEWEAALAVRPDSCELLWNVGLGRVTMGSRSDAVGPLRMFLERCRDGFGAQRAKATEWIRHP